MFASVSPESVTEYLQAWGKGVSPHQWHWKGANWLRHTAQWVRERYQVQCGDTTQKGGISSSILLPFAALVIGVIRSRSRWSLVLIPSFALVDVTINLLYNIETQNSHTCPSTCVLRIEHLYQNPKQRNSVASCVPGKKQRFCVQGVSTQHPSRRSSHFHSRIYEFCLFLAVQATPSIKGSLLIN